MSTQHQLFEALAAFRTAYSNVERLAAAWNEASALADQLSEEHAVARMHLTDASKDLHRIAAELSQEEWAVLGQKLVGRL